MCRTRVSVFASHKVYQSTNGSTHCHTSRLCPFLAPFISDEEHYEAIRYISGVFAEFEDVPGLQMDAVFPDLYVTAFWKRGIERDYFQREESRRQGDFIYVLKKIWGTIDYIEMTQGHPPNKTEVLGISFKEYKDARRRGLRLQRTRH